MRKPDFFIVGAHKCGTTAMSHYLGLHPEVYMATRNESLYFASDLHSQTSLEDYLSYFEEVDTERRIGEKSVGYLLSEVAAKNIKAFDPAAEIIVMLRKPTEMVYSLYWQQKYRGYEDKPTFREAIDAEPKRKQGLEIPTLCWEPKMLWYREIANYAPQVKRFLDLFGTEQVLVILYDDFKSDIDSVYKATLQFLDVDIQFVPPQFNPVNTHKTARSILLWKFLNSEFLKKARAFGSWPPHEFRRKISKQIGDYLKRINTRHTERPPMDEDLRKELDDYFRPGIHELENVIDRDLSHWL